MLKLLKFEFHKLIRQKSTYICILIPFIFLFLEILINKLIYMNDNAQIPTTINILKTSLATTNLTLILAIFIAINVTEDYAEQTIKNIYGKGYSRESVYLTKYIIIILYTLINVSRYKAVFKHLASWGFIVAGNEDNNHTVKVSLLIH